MKLQKAQRIILSSSLSVFVAGCGAPNFSPSETHITVEEVNSQKPVASRKSIPALVKTSPTAPVFSGEKGSDTYDLVVTGQPVRDVLFALARDSGLNMDVDADVSGYITMTALDQTLDAILERIGKQVDIRVEAVGDAILIRADKPYQKIYHVDFLNISRTYSSGAASSGVGGGQGAVSSNATNDFWANIETSIEAILGSYQSNAGTDGLVANLQNEEEATRAAEIQGARTRVEGDPYHNLNPETGVLVVYAPERLQKQVREFLDSVLSIAKRQVLLEATVVEVVLNNQYVQGIDWSLFNHLAEDGLALYQGAVGGPAAALRTITREFTETRNNVDSGGYYKIPPGGTAEDARRNAEKAARDFYAEVAGAGNVITDRTYTITPVTGADGSTIIGYNLSASASAEQLNEIATERLAGGLTPNQPGSGGLFSAAYRAGDLSAAVQLLDTFGDAKVLSSPRISALNYQPALLRVVDQEVYFNIEVTDEINETTGNVTGRTYDVTENTVDVGFAMNVLPQINADGEIILNLKPSVTRVLDYRAVPSPVGFGTTEGSSNSNFVPITRVRELESVISLRDGEVAVLGGLLEDRTADNNSSVPGLSRLPGIGAIFEKKNEQTFKTEFVVFIRARVIKNPSLNGDYSDFKHLLPNSDFIMRERGNTFLPPAQKKAQ
jgi:general secretion pathway protein D